MNACRRLLRTAFLVVASFAIVHAQVTPVVSRVNVGQANQNEPLTLSVDLTQNVGITQVMFVYRPFGQSEFEELEMSVIGRSASITVPADVVVSPYIEYYVRVNMVGGKVETYPIQNADTNPLKIPVKEPDPKDLEVRLMSPAPGSTVAIEDLGIVVSFFYASPAINPKATKILLDGADVSAEAILSEDLLIYSPQNFDIPLAVGEHTIRIELADTNGQPYHSIQRRFTLRTAEQIAEEETRWRGRMDGQAEIRNEALSSGTTTYIRGDVRANAEYSVFTLGGLVHLDNQDKPEVQPQNRFNIFGQTDWLRLEYGDAYPRFPSLMVSGKRVRGFSGSLATGVINLDVSFGQTLRAIEGTVDSVAAVDTSTTVLPKGSRLLRDTTYEFFSGGTFKRNFLAVRTSFGSYDGTQFGIGFVKAKDDIASVQRATLPEENLVVGADFRIAFDDERFKWENQASLSLTNTDISGGSFDQADYDQLKQQDKEAGEQLERVGKIAEKIITINEFLFPTNPVGQGLPSVAFESNLTLNYLNNYITAGFFRRGASYQSFGNDFLQTDIQGFMVSDRIRMFDNRVYLSVSYERKNDNTADTKQGTTNFNNLNTSLTVSPRNFPAFTLGYGFNDRIADYEVFDPDSTETSKFADETTNRFFFGSNYDFTAMGNRQTVSVSVSVADKKDRTFLKANQNNLFVQLNWSTEYRIPLQTTLGFSISNNRNDLQTYTLSGQDSILSINQFDYTSVSVGARYRLFGDQLRLAADVVPIFGAISRVNIQAGALYVISSRHNLEFLLNFIQNSNLADDVIASLMYRFNF